MTVVTRVAAKGRRYGDLITENPPRAPQNENPTVAGGAVLAFAAVGA